MTSEKHILPISSFIATSLPRHVSRRRRAKTNFQHTFDTSRIGMDDRIVIAGSGLSALEMVAALHRRGHRGPITLISRTGLLPRTQPNGDFTGHGEDLFRHHQTAASLLRSVRRTIEQVTSDGLPWQSVMDALRHQAHSSGQAWRSVNA